MVLLVPRRKIIPHNIEVATTRVIPGPLTRRPCILYNYSGFRKHSISNGQNQSTHNDQVKNLFIPKAKTEICFLQILLSGSLFDINHSIESLQSLLCTPGFGQVTPFFLTGPLQLHQIGCETSLHRHLRVSTDVLWSCRLSHSHPSRSSDQSDLKLPQSMIPLPPPCFNGWY